LSKNSILSQEAGFIDSELGVNEVLVKVMLKQGDFFEKAVQVSNNGGSAESVSVVVSGLEDLVYVDESSFTLEVGQVKTLDLSFISFIEGYYYEPGVYLGSLNFQYGEEEVILPIVVEIESSETLFDMNLDFSVNDRYVVLGGTALADITVYNFAELDMATVDMMYVVSDVNGNRLLTEEENLVVETQASVSKSIFVPDSFEEGKYIFYSTVTYGDSVGTASYLFDVASGEPDSKLSLGSICAPEDPLCWISLVILVILIFFIGAYAYFYLGSFLYKKVGLNEKNITDKKVKKNGPILYFFVLLVIIILVIVLFYLSNFMSVQSLFSSFSNMPAGVLWAILILLVFIVILVILNTIFGLLDNLTNYFSRADKGEERRKEELVREIIEKRKQTEVKLQEESLNRGVVPEKKERSFFSSIGLYFAKRKKEKEKRRKADERKRALMRREEERKREEQERMRLAAERKRALEIKRREAEEKKRKEEAAKKKKVGVFASISGYFARRKKENEKRKLAKKRKKKLELKKKEEEHNKKTKEELRKDRETQLGLKKEWDINEKRRKVEERKVRAAEIALEKAERNKQMQIEREIEEERKKKKEDKRRKEEKKKLEKARRKRRKKPLFGFGGKGKVAEVKKDTSAKTIDVLPVDPRQKVVELMKNCNRNIAHKNYQMAESYYEQIKPIYAKLTKEEKRFYYSALVELQNRMVMLNMELVKDKLKKRRFRV